MTKKKIVRIALSFVIVGLTIAAFVYYMSKHPDILEQLGKTPPQLIALLLLLYIPAYLGLVLVLHSSLQLYKKRLGLQENFLLNAYSSLLNFFGPGQSGPALRGVYLLKRHGLRVRDYVFSTLIYYAFFAVISAVFLCIGSRTWWHAVLFVGAVGGLSFLVLRRFAKKPDSEKAQTNFRLTVLVGLFAATLLQLGMQVVIYYVELHNIDPHISWSQVLTYTGAANFATFVALTPGAIGIRESFLLFTQQLHHIDSATIVGANVIDRGVYLLLLGLLAIAVVGLHAKDRLRIKQIEPDLADQK